MSNISAFRRRNTEATSGKSYKFTESGSEFASKIHISLYTKDECAVKLVMDSGNKSMITFS